MRTKTFLAFSLSLSTLLVLSACQKTPAEPPEQVILKFKQEATQIQSGDLRFRLNLNGADQQDTLGLKGGMDLRFDARDPENPKRDLELSLEGSLKQAGEALAGKVGIAIRAIGPRVYFKLESLESDHPTVATLEPLLEPQMKRWLELPPEFIPEDWEAFQGGDEANREKREKLKALFRDTRLLEVIKEYGIKTINGVKAYHYGVRFQEEGVRQFLRQAAAVNERPLTDEELESSLKFVRRLQEAELWIGAKDYHLHKAEFSFRDPEESGEARLRRGEARLSLKVEFEGEDYGREMKIEAPEKAEPFNPLSLLGGASPTP